MIYYHIGDPAETTIIYMTHICKFTTVSLLEYLLFLPYPVFGKKSEHPNLPTPPRFAACRCKWRAIGLAVQDNLREQGRKEELALAHQQHYLRVAAANSSHKLWRKVCRRVSMRYPWKPMMCYVKKTSFFLKKAGSSRNTPRHVFGDRYSHTQGGSEALSVLLSCYVGGVGWGGVGWGGVGWGGVGWGGAIKFMFTCTHRIGYIMISCLALAHRRHATLWYLLLHLHNLANTRDATLWYLLLNLHNLEHTWCCVMISSLGQNLRMEIHTNLAKWQLTDNTKKRMENVQIKLFVKWSKHIQTHHSWNSRRCKTWGIFVKQMQGCQEPCYIVLPCFWWHVFL